MSQRAHHSAPEIHYFKSRMMDTGAGGKVNVNGLEEH
jgi:hypothetical protein